MSSSSDGLYGNLGPLPIWALFLLMPAVFCVCKCCCACLDFYSEATRPRSATVEEGILNVCDEDFDLKQQEVSTESKPDSSSSTTTLTMTERDKNSTEALRIYGTFGENPTKADKQIFEKLDWLINHTDNEENSEEEKMSLEPYRGHKLGEQEKKELAEKERVLMSKLVPQSKAKFESRFPAGTAHGKVQRLK